MRQQLIKNIALLGHIELPIYVNAGRWTYSDPEATAKRYCEGHNALMLLEVEKILNYATDADLELAKKLATEYVQGYKVKYEKRLFADSRCASSFITGGSNFPVARMQKRNAIATKRNEELVSWCEWKMKKIKNTLQPTIIKSNDSEAITKLDEKLNNLIASQEMMKNTNKLIKKWQKSESKEDTKIIIASLKEAGLNDSFIKEALDTRYKRLGFASYALTNNNANIRSTKQRLEKLKKDAETAEKIEAGEIEEKEHTFTDGKVLYNYEAQRVQILFDDIPNVEIRTLLKGIGCRWSNKNKAWQMHLKEWNYRQAIEALTSYYKVA